MTDPTTDDLDLENALTTIDTMAAGDAHPQPICAGTFVAYPMPNGGIHLVANIEHAAPGLGIPHGEYRRTIPPSLIRLLGGLASGGGMLGKLGRRRVRDE